MTKTRNHMPVTGDIGGLAENMLRKSEDKYRLIAENTADVISIIDMNLRVIYVSPSVKTLLGYTVEEALGLPHDQIISSEFLPMVHKAFEEEMILEANGTANPGRTRIMELKEYRKDGSTVWVEIGLSFLRDENRKSTGILAVTRDITRRKLAEEELSKSEEKYRLIAENTADVISIWDMNLRAVYISPSVKRLRGYTVEDAMGLPYDQFILPEFLPMIHKTFEEEMILEASGTADPGRTRIMELKEYRKDGSGVWVEIALSFLRDEQQKPVGILSITRDITERKAAETLRHAEARYRALFEYSPNGVLLIDPETCKALEANDIAQRQLGYTREELLALRISDYEALETPEETARHINKSCMKEAMILKPCIAPKTARSGMSRYGQRNFSWQIAFSAA